MGFIHLLAVASIPVAKVLLITAVGMFLALERIDLLGENSRNHLNKIVFYVFSPCLIAANLAKTVTLQSFLSLWFMPINILIAFIIGAILGWILVRVTRPPKHLKGLVIGTCSAGNMGIFPIILIPAICKEKGSPFGATHLCETYALSYSSLSLAIGAVYIWSLIYNIVRMSAEEEAKENNYNYNSSEIPINDSNQEPLLPCNQHLSLPPSHQVSLPIKINQSIRTCLGKVNLKAVLAPSTIAAILGFAIGMISPIQKLMIGIDAPLHVVTDSAFMLGEAAIPVLTIILGANLLQGLKGTGIRARVILGIVATRFVVLPLLGILVVKGALRAGLVPSHNKLFIFLLHLQYSMPPAINLGTMTQLFGAGRSECSVIMLWTYGLASIFLTLWSTLFLWIVT